MKQYGTTIWEGRFQPIHRGHLAYIGKLLSLSEDVWLIVVANERSTDVVDDPSKLPVPEFSHEVDPHHRAEKNLLPYWVRYRCVLDAVRNEFGADAPITVMGGRRLDLQWDLYSKILPPNRVFLTPTRDSFEDAKARAWRKLGERCERIDVDDLPRISATMIRERIAAGLDVSDLLRPETYRALVEGGFADKLRQL